MAVGTTAAILGGTAIAGGFAKSASAAKQRKEAKRAAKNFRRQTPTNVHRGRRISTRGAELQTDELNRTTATAIDALRSGGVRGVANVGSVLEANNRANRQIAVDLDAQQVALDRDIAYDDARIQQMQENRDNQELAAIQGQMNAANEQFYSGLGDVASGFGAFAGGMGSNNPTNVFGDTKRFLDNYQSTI